MTDTTEWVSLGEAAKILGVHPATVRNWADRGELPFRRTPGGHRRFRRLDLLQWAASQHSTQPAEAQIIVQSAMGRILMEMMDEGQLSSQGWYAKLSRDARETLRSKVRRLMDALLYHLASTTSSNHGSSPSTAVEVGYDYAALMQKYGLSLVDAVRGFAFFHHFVIDAVIQLSETTSPRSASEWGDLLRQVYTFTDEVLLAVIERYERNKL
ncbi:MAG: helix-turn-helix domain-containing protein [Anaerolineae bacterium]|nr:helix-turn-helix domain-containing protein [Anaerolineae bacterium]